MDNWPGRSYGTTPKYVNITDKIDANGYQVSDEAAAQAIRDHLANPLGRNNNLEEDEMTAPLSTWGDAEQDLLTTADSVVNRRDEQYGACHDHHAATAAMWSVYLGHTVLPEQVSAMFILDKIVRSRTEDKPDHWVDVAGYSAVHAKVQAEAERQNG